MPDETDTNINSTDSTSEPIDTSPVEDSGSGVDGGQQGSGVDGSVAPLSDPSSGGDVSGGGADQSLTGASDSSSLSGDQSSLDQSPQPVQSAPAEGPGSDQSTLEPVAEPVSQPVGQTSADPVIQPIINPAPAAPASQPGSSLAQKFLDNMKSWRQKLMKAAEDREQKRFAEISRVYELAQSKKYITREDVMNYLHCGHTAAAEYLAELVKEGKIKTEGAPHYKDQKYEVLE